MQFSEMMEDIRFGKDGISFVLVFKLSHFGRNAADVLSTLRVMQDFGVDLICVEDGIDSSKKPEILRTDAGENQYAGGHNCPRPGNCQLMEALIEEVQIYVERQPNGQWLKSIKFRLPIIEDSMELSLDNDNHVETCALITKSSKA